MLLLLGLTRHGQQLLTERVQCGLHLIALPLIFNGHLECQRFETLRELLVRGRELLRLGIG